MLKEEATCNNHHLQESLDAWAPVPEEMNVSSSAVQYIVLGLLTAFTLTVVALLFKRFRLMKKVAARNWLIAEHDVQLGDRLSFVNSHLSLR